MNLDDRVAAGMAVLDETFPGWVDLIDLDRLDMNAPDFCPDLATDCGCVLAQVDSGKRRRPGSYDELLVALRGHWDSRWAEEHGFDEELGQDAAALGPAYENLTEAWRRAILARRSAVTP